MWNENLQVEAQALPEEVLEFVRTYLGQEYLDAIQIHEELKRLRFNTVNTLGRSLLSLKRVPNPVVSGVSFRVESGSVRLVMSTNSVSEQRLDRANRPHSSGSPSLIVTNTADREIDAIVFSNHGKLHSDVGPARIYKNGESVEYWINGTRVSLTDFVSRNFSESQFNF